MLKLSVTWATRSLAHTCVVPKRVVQSNNCGLLRAERATLFRGTPANRKMATKSKPVDEQANEVLAFWFGDYSGPKFELWFKSSKETDELIRRRFGGLVDEALDGGLKNWEEDIKLLLAKMIICDQFTRNIYRRTSKAFDNDPAGLRCAKTITAQFLAELHPYEVGMLGLPYEHSEIVKDHDAGKQMLASEIERRSDSMSSTENDLLTQFLKYMDDHKAIIEKFGRYPHRNEVLGRTNTRDEAEYLKTADTYGQ
ncbi:hypothetical protein SARC_09278 [Sphaeroforma arctica JP610]|uniref:DUF924-domain-containing protein n=1 Tax=Sphaeroforma arctica JP610 TaxID=667725 RepID=A0A0L0FNB2_9EUKA|nr:hypothetical protein SARC_09278 [Sphaeroforma arctica JP610]KNC78285.1 hypothetical protein SARC_09278 [Sphaeroforma arctica JP610]|eukprot:XP_014152187.1 hypothetical protein SARC_09278 [Sphaeroforma arctica JP610]